MEIGQNRPFSPFSAFFALFSEGPNSTWTIQKTEEKGLLPQVSWDLLKPPSLNGGHLKPITLKPISRIFRIFRFFDAPHLQKVRADLFGGFFCGFCKVNLRRGLPHRRSSRGHNWRSAKAHKINLPPQNLRHFLFLCHSHSHSHCNTVMHMTRSQRACYPPQRKGATSATQGQGGTTYRNPFQLIAIATSQSVPKAPAAKLLATPPRPPFNKADIPNSRNCSGKSAPTQQSFL